MSRSFNVAYPARYPTDRPTAQTPQCAIVWPTLADRECFPMEDRRTKGLRTKMEQPGIPGFVSFRDEATAQMLISFLTSLWPPEKTESDGAGAFRAKIIFPAAMGTVATGHNLCSTAGGPPLDSHFFPAACPLAPRQFTTSPDINTFRLTPLSYRGWG